VKIIDKIKALKGRHYLLLAGALLALMVIFQSQCHRFKTEVDITENQKTILRNLGKKALLSNDVPVAAILVYKGEVIGEGYNTVKKDSNLGGHAEINAISDAYAKYGEAFHDLDRDELSLYSTFEPCEMCKGAMLHYNIKNVYFEQAKEFGTQVKGTVKSFIFELKKRRFDADGLQESMFEQHPDYDKQ